MMGLFKRASEVAQSKIHKLLDRFEDPNAMLDMNYDKMLDGLQEVRASLADVATEQYQLKNQMAALDKDVSAAEAEAKEALKVGREDLAKNALHRKQGTIASRERIQEAYDKVTAQLDRLKSTERSLSARIQQFKTDKEVTKATYKAASANVRVSESMAGVGKALSNVGDSLNRAKDKADQMVARADAITDLVDEGILQDPLDTRDKTTRELDNIRRQGAVDEELEQMKRELGQ